MTKEANLQCIAPIAVGSAIHPWRTHAHTMPPMPIRLAAAVAFFTLLAPSAQAQTASAQASQRPPCDAAADDQYGFARDRAIQVGGSPMYGAARQRRYLESLRGPEGQPVTYKRRGQDRAPDDTILDAYEVVYDGLEKPLVLFLDWYHYSPPQLPRGFSCAGPINLGLPPVDPFKEAAQRRALAAAPGGAADLSPIPLQLEGKSASVVIYDEFRLLVLAARAAAADGATPGPEQPPAALKGIGMIVVVHPHSCEGRLLAPSGVGIHGQNGALVPKPSAQPLPPEQLAQVLPGVALPDGARAFAYQLPRPRPNDTVVASYQEDGCGVTGNVLKLPVRMTPAKPLTTPSPEPPADLKEPATVFLQAILDHAGQFQQPVYIGGPKALEPAAREALAKWRAEPLRFNGAPMDAGILLQIRFTAK